MFLNYINNYGVMFNLLNTIIISHLFKEFNYLIGKEVLFMSNDWACQAVAIMHKLKMTNIQLAAKTGYTPEYISMLLNGKRNAKVAERKIMEVLEQQKSRPA